MTTLSILHLLSPTFIPDATLLTKSVNDRLGKKKEKNRRWGLETTSHTPYKTVKIFGQTTVGCCKRPLNPQHDFYDKSAIAIPACSIWMRKFKNK